MTATSSEPATEHDEAPASPAPVRPKRVSPLRKLNDEQEREVTRLYVETVTPLVEIGQRFGIGQTSVARIAQRHGAPLRSPTISRAMASDRPGSAAADTEAAMELETEPVQPESKAIQPAAEPRVAPTARVPKAVTSRRRASPVDHRPSAELPVERPAAKAPSIATTLRRFVVTFAVEQVLEAESALVALQQAQTRGATEITSIVRIA